MESDSFFCQLFQRLPQTLFELLGLPIELAKVYDFDPVEIKKSYRLDGLFRPKRSELPAYFLEVQFYAKETFYLNLFAKVFGFLNQNPNIRDWHAVAIFETRNLEPSTPACEDLIESKRVTRVYLDELQVAEEASIGIGILKLVTEPESNLPGMVHRLIRRTHGEVRDREMSRTIVELVEELLIRRFAGSDREEIRKMFNLTDIRKTAVWREAHEEGIEKGVDLAKREFIRNCLNERMPVAKIAALVGVPQKVVRRIAKENSK